MRNNGDMYNVNGELTFLLNSYNTIITGAYSINPVYKKSALKFFVEEFDETIKAMEEEKVYDYYVPVQKYGIDEIKYCIDRFINREEISQEQLKLAQLVITEMFKYKYHILSNQLFDIYNDFIKTEVCAI